MVPLQRTLFQHNDNLFPLLVKDRKGKERRGKKQTKQNVKQQPSWNDKNQNKGTTFHTQKKTSEMFQQKEYGKNNYTPEN